MAITLVSTAGAANANTYVSLDDANAFFETRIYSSTWDDADSEDQKASLVLATELLDIAYNWVGIKASSTQNLRWPRLGALTPDSELIPSTSIPDFLAKATAEFAAALLQDDRLREPGDKGFSQLKVGPIYLQVAKSDRKKVVPPAVDFMLADYGEESSTGGTRRLERC